MGTESSSLKNMAQDNIDYQKNLSDKYKKEIEITRSIRRLNSIAANFIRHTDRIEEDKCKDIIILTESILKQNFEHLELENILKQTSNKEMIYFLDKNEFLMITDKLKNKENFKYKKEACKKIAKFYIDIKFIFDAIKDVIDDTRDDEYKYSQNRNYENYKTITIKNITYEMIEKLNIKKEKQLTIKNYSDTITDKFINKVYNETGVRLTDITTPIIVLRSDLEHISDINKPDKNLYKITLQFKKTKSLNKIRIKEYKSFCQSRIESLMSAIDAPSSQPYETICNTYNTENKNENILSNQKALFKLNPDITYLQKLKNIEKKNIETCKYLDRNNNCLSLSIAKLEDKFIEIISTTKKNYTNNINSIYAFIDELFIEDNNGWTIKQDLTISKLERLKIDVGKAISKCYIDCEKDYKMGLDLYKAYIESTKLKKNCDNTYQYRLDEEKYKKELNLIDNMFLSFESNPSYKKDSIIKAKTDIDRIIRGRNIISDSDNTSKINVKIEKYIDIFINDYIKKWKKDIETIQNSRDEINIKILQLEKEKNLIIQRKKLVMDELSFDKLNSDIRPTSEEIDTNIQKAKDAAKDAARQETEEWKDMKIRLDQLGGKYLSVSNSIGGSTPETITNIDNEIKQLKQLVSTYNEKIKLLHENFFINMKQTFQEATLQSLSNKYEISTTVILTLFNKKVNDLSKIQNLEINEEEIKLKWWSEKISSVLTSYDVNTIQEYYIQLRSYQQVKSLFQDDTKEQKEAIKNSSLLYQKQKELFDNLVNKISDKFSLPNSPKYKGQVLTKDNIKKIFYNMFKLNTNVIKEKTSALDQI